MTRYYCDICKMELESCNEMVCIDFNHFGVLRGIEDNEIQVCIACATRARNAILALKPKEANNGE